MIIDGGSMSKEWKLADDLDELQALLDGIYACLKSETDKQILARSSVYSAICHLEYAQACLLDCPVDEEKGEVP